MGEPGDAGPATGPPDRQTLQLLERRLSDHSLVSTTEFEPDRYEPRRLRAQLDGEQFPDTVAATRLDARWFTTDDFSVHYVEARTDATEWDCRWDRHPNEHNARLHFHRPPDGTEIADLAFESTHPMEVSVTVMEAVEQRLASLWQEY